MRELWDFRLKEKCSEALNCDFQLVVGKTDPQFLELCTIDQRLRELHSVGAYFSFHAIRKYSEKELQKAQLFWLRSPSHVYLADANIWRQFDSSAACKVCGGGQERIRPLEYRSKQIPKNFDFVRTETGELLISEQLLEMFNEHCITGYEVRETIDRTSAKSRTKIWFQLLVTSKKLRLAPENRTGEGPFQHLLDSKRNRCTNTDPNHQIGVAQVSEVFVRDFPSSDINSTSELVGGLQGIVVRPQPLLLVSPRIREIFVKHKIRKAIFEIAHLTS